MEWEPQAGIRGGQGVSLILNTENMRPFFWFLLAVVLSMELGELGAGRVATFSTALSCHCPSSLGHHSPLGVPLSCPLFSSWAPRPSLPTSFCALPLTFIDS